MMKKMIGAWCVMAGGLCLAAPEIERKVTESADVGPRIRRLDRSWLFSERQPSIPLWNFIPQKYIDRPLFTDISLRKTPDMWKAGFYREVEILKWSGFDGFGSIAYTGLYHQQLAYLVQEPVKDYVQFPILWNFYKKGLERTDGHYQELKKMIVAADQSAATMKIDGKPLVWMWGNANDQHHSSIKLLKTDPEIPPFVCFVMDPFLPAYLEYNDEKSPGKVSQKTLDRYRADVEELLTWADGLKVRVCERIGTHPGEHGRSVFADPLCRNHLFPILREIMDRPENAKKYIGVELEQAYINQLNGPCLGQFGTETLRTFWNEALLLNPDILVGFEWNEANENTSFQPTASGAGTVARVSAYYKQLLNGGTFSPRPGDDVTIPNLVVSTRRSLRADERYHVEMLYVPDGTDMKCRARVLVRDQDGRTLAACPWETLPCRKLTAFDYRMDGAAFGGVNAVYPVVEVEKDGVTTVYEGFDSAKVNPSWCIDYLYARQPLRELIRGPKCDFKVTKTDGGYAFKADFSCDEELSALEVMEDNYEKLAANPESCLDRAKYEIFRGTFSHMKPLKIKEVTFDVEGSDAWQLLETGTQWNNFFVKEKGPSKGPKTAKASFSGGLSTFLVAVPKEDLARARFKVSVPTLEDQPLLSLAKLKDIGRYLFAWKEKNVTLELESLDMIPDYGLPPNANHASISAVLPSSAKHPVFHVRATAKSGRVWRSKPVVPVKGFEYLDLDYDLADETHGAFLPVPGGDMRFWGRLGGGWEGGEPIWWEAQGWQPTMLTKDFKSVFPERVVEDGRKALSFDGRGQYLVFPRETIPCDGEYSVRFEMKALSSTNQVLMRLIVQPREEQNVRLLIRDGELYLSHFGPAHGVADHFATGLKVKVGEWQTVKIVRAKDKLRISLDGEERAYDYHFGSVSVQSLIFGGNCFNGLEMKGVYRPYCGFLRSFRVTHGK